MSCLVCDHLQIYYQLIAKFVTKNIPEFGQQFAAELMPKLVLLNSQSELKCLNLNSKWWLCVEYTA